jgi:nitronate monooxygenase
VLASRNQGSRIESLLGIEHPLIQSPMAGVQGAELAAAISNAGALGSLPCAMLNAEALEAELRILFAATDKPFNLNFFCHQPPSVNPQQQSAWYQCLSGYFDELGLETPDGSETVVRQPFSKESMSVLETHRPAVVSFHFGLPGRNELAEIKRWGTRVISSATTVDEAVWLTERGVDAVIAQGLEAGGHRGSFLTKDMTTQMGTLALVAQISNTVAVPVIAAGGIAGPEGVVAALALGAAGVQVGTTFLLCPEARTSSLHRAALKSKESQHTALTNVFSGRPARSIVNRLVHEVGPISKHATEFPSAAGPVSLLRAAAEPRGIHDFTPLWCGQNATGCSETPAAEVLQYLVSKL